MRRSDNKVVVQTPPWKQEELNCSAGMSEGNNLCWRDINAAVDYSGIVCTFEIPSIISLNFHFDTSDTYLIENKPFIERPALQNGCELCVLLEKQVIISENKAKPMRLWVSIYQYDMRAGGKRKNKWAFFHIKYASMFFPSGHPACQWIFQEAESGGSSPAAFLFRQLSLEETQQWVHWTSEKAFIHFSWASFTHQWWISSIF